MNEESLLRPTLALALVPLAALPLIVAPALAQAPSPTVPPAPSGCPTPGPDGRPVICDDATQSPTPTPTSTETYDPDPPTPTQRPDTPECHGISIPTGTDHGQIDVRTIAGRPAVLGYSLPAATSTVTITRTSPDLVAVVREQEVEGHSAEFSFNTMVNTTVESTVDADDPSCKPLVRRISVSPQVGLNARRDAPRDYTFSGRVFPARGQLMTLRTIPRQNTDNEPPRIIAQGRVDAHGIYTIDRRFLGSGEFIVYATAGAVPSNAAGTALGRPTVIH